MKESFSVKGMSCQHCVMRVTKALEEMPGVETVEVDLATGTVTVVHTDGAPGTEELKNAITKAGYTVAA